MPRPKRDAHLYELAKRGAQARLADLAQEAKYLIAMFPDLRDSYDKDELPLSFIMARDAGRVARPPRRRRRRMSAAARKAVSMRMRKYWTQRRKQSKA